MLYCLFLIYTYLILPVPELHLSSYTACSYSTLIILHCLFLIYTYHLILPVPNLHLPYTACSWTTLIILYCPFLIYTYHLRLPVPELHFTLHYLFLIYIIISLTVTNRELSPHCLFLIYNCILLPTADLQFSFPLPLSPIQISFLRLFLIHAWLILDMRNSVEWPIS